MWIDHLCLLFVIYEIQSLIPLQKMGDKGYIILEDYISKRCLQGHWKRYSLDSETAVRSGEDLHLKIGRDRIDNWRFSKSNDLRKERLGAYIRKKPVIRLRKTLRPSWLIISLFHLQESVKLFFKIVALFFISTSLWQEIKKRIQMSIGR